MAKHIYLVHHEYTQLLVETFTNGDIKQFIRCPLKQQSQINMVVAAHDF
jgi:hypothetical protein